MRELPILFNGDMVRAILDRRKTETRRPVKPQPVAPSMPLRDFTVEPAPVECDGSWAWRWEQDYPDGWDMAHTPIRSPLGSPGDMLYVRETWADIGTPAQRAMCYRASHEALFQIPVKWRPSIHMPKRAARIWLRVEEVSVMRVQDIAMDPSAIEREGLSLDVPGAHLEPGIPDYTRSFRMLWDSIYAAKGYGWDTDCWVWSVRFSVVSTTGRPG
jgi:hypothetical protein